MAVKMLLAVVAALCAFAAVTGGPAHLFQDAALDKPHVLDHAALQRLDGEKLGWINVTEILEKIEQSLQRLQDKIEEVSEEVQSAVQTILDDIEKAAESTAEKWAEDVAKWVAQANSTSIDVQECLDAEQAPLAQVTAELKADAQACIADRVDKLNKSLANVQAVSDAAARLWEEAKAKLEKCSSLGNPVSVTVCLITTTPFVEVKAMAIIAEGTAAVTLAATEVAAVIPMATLCTSEATAGRAAQVSAIVDATVTCIKEKLAA